VIREDARGRRVAIVADFLVNPDAPFYAGIVGRPGPLVDLLVEDGWGLMKPPPHVLGEGVGRPAAATIAGDASDYLRHGYSVVILAADGIVQGGVWLEYLAAAFRELGTPMPPVMTVGLAGTSTVVDLRAALSAATARATTGA